MVPRNSGHDNINDKGNNNRHHRHNNRDNGSNHTTPFGTTMASATAAAATTQPQLPRQQAQSTARSFSRKLKHITKYYHAVLRTANTMHNDNHSNSDRKRVVQPKLPRPPAPARSRNIPGVDVGDREGFPRSQAIRQVQGERRLASGRLLFLQRKFPRNTLGGFSQRKFPLEYVWALSKGFFACNTFLGLRRKDS